VAGLGMYWHTIRHLRPSQIFGRAGLRFRTKRVGLGPPPALREARAGTWVNPVSRRPSMLGPSTLRFLNKTEDLDQQGWDNPAVERLWRYNLHYFEDLNADDARSRREWHIVLMERWVKENPPTIGSGWEPYPTSLRIVNWMKWSLSGNVLSSEVVQSLAVQTRWLAGRLETHLLGNHLLANAKALVFAGSFFVGSEAEKWLEAGIRLLDREIPEQILADGGHFERSTMYHALALEDVLDLCNVAAAFSDVPTLRERQDVWRARVGPMRHWLTAMLHPDGEISFFNDAAFGIAPSPDELDDYAIRLGCGPGAPILEAVTHLSQSGYVRLQRDQAVLILDVGLVGPDYQPAHAHADTLGFELSLFGQRVFVNSGTSLYGKSDERERQRGTAAHNTVVIDGENSSEVWAGFRVARRAHPTGLSIASKDPIVVQCSHDGYARLRDSPKHTRSWIMRRGNLQIDDGISGNFTQAEARFHIHPTIQIEEFDVEGNGDIVVVLKLPQDQRVRIMFDAGPLKHEQASWHPEFGRSEPNVCLVRALNGASARTLISWSSTA
jgi:uncharacterized heparinase superfamily protein